MWVDRTYGLTARTVRPRTYSQTTASRVAAVTARNGQTTGGIIGMAQPTAGLTVTVFQNALQPVCALMVTMSLRAVQVTVSLIRKREVQAKVNLKGKSKQK